MSAARQDLHALFSHLCELASSGAAIACDLVDAPDDMERCASLATALRLLFGQVGFIGEMGVRSCGDPGQRETPAAWLVGETAAQALQPPAMAKGAHA
jgi:hypothetical protein